jgi:hypothetical protein
MVPSTLRRVVHHSLLYLTIPVDFDLAQQFSQPNEKPTF